MLPYDSLLVMILIKIIVSKRTSVLGIKNALLKAFLAFSEKKGRIYLAPAMTINLKIIAGY